MFHFVLSSLFTNGMQKISTCHFSLMTLRSNMTAAINQESDKSYKYLLKTDKSE